MRHVSLLEAYVGCRISRVGKFPLVQGGDVVDVFTPVTFAADFSFFKKIMTLAFKVSGCRGVSETISLRELNINMPLPAFQMGWPMSLECEVFEALSSFVRTRPVVSTQSLSRPWHPT